MKPLILLARIMIVGCFWSVFFLEGIRVIMLRNWRFDIINSEHWEFAWALWADGWIIADAKEWAFILIILTFIPLWITGWASLSIIPWERIFIQIVTYPIVLLRIILNKQIIGFNKLKRFSVPATIQKKASYKEVRPRGARLLPESIVVANIKKTKKQARNIANTKYSPKLGTPSLSEASNKSSVFEHSLMLDDENDTNNDFLFDLDIFDIDLKKDDNNNTKEKSYKKEPEIKERPFSENKRRDSRTKPFVDERKKEPEAPKKPANNNEKKPEISMPPREPKGGVPDILKENNYRVFTSTAIENALIDFIGVAKNKIAICLIDREPGDWLGDEEKFNNEEPLWFSESSHRISPVRRLEIAKKYLEHKLKKESINKEVDAYLIIQLGNIINAEDMIPVWKDKDINVTRIDRGSPKDIMLFNRELKKGIQIPYSEFEEIRKIIREN